MSSPVRISFKNVTYLVGDSLPHDKDEAFYESFFDRKSILGSADTEQKGGRGKTLLYRHYDKDLVLRHYKRGGLIGKLIADRFFCFEPHSHRAFDEFELLDRMLALSLPVPKPVIAREESYIGSLRQDIVIQRLSSYKDLSYVIDHRHLTRQEFQAIGRTIRMFFDNGIHHTDLNIRNILIDDSCRVCIIDFDKCFKLDVLPEELAKSMLSRLLRSFKKEASKKETTCFNESDFAFLAQEAL